MYLTRNKLFSRSAFTGYKDAAVDILHFVYKLEYIFHQRAFAYDAVAIISVLQFAFQIAHTVI
ncbi:hypothetical protein SDC9_166243 [bioreactor metagenome]|uniref:Uncharacterized protein n=1 Tax=bioreactor metagenome TaxID=1076179 RepID=A0A645FWH7_9ZZZZ